MEVFQNISEDEFPLDLFLLDLDDFKSVEDSSPSSSLSITPTTSNETSPIVSPKVPSVFGKSGRFVNPVPRHKRSCHISAEIRRRGNIKTCLETLQTLVPTSSSRSGSKDSKSMQLLKVANHCRGLEASCKSHATELCALRCEIEALNSDISDLQSSLPESGAAQLPKVTATDPNYLVQMFEEYIRKRTYTNWKYWIFGIIIRPLFDVYVSSVDTTSTHTFISSIGAWITQHLSLSNLRPTVTRALLTLCTTTEIMTQPETVPEQVMFHMLQTERAST